MLPHSPPPEAAGNGGGDETPVYTNIRIADFAAAHAAANAAPNVFYLWFKPPDLSAIAKQVLYQLYPGQINQTFYTLPPGQMLIAYLISGGGEQELVQVGATRHADQYLYFEMVPGKHVGCVAVVAKDEEEGLSHALAWLHKK